jgi:hypothetical protein
VGELFVAKGTIESVRYSLIATGSSTASASCKFGLVDKFGGMRDIGQIASGSGPYPANLGNVNVGDRLLWWGCDIQPTCADESEGVCKKYIDGIDGLQDEFFNGVSSANEVVFDAGLAGMTFESLEVDVVASDSLETNLHYDEVDRTIKVEWTQTRGHHYGLEVTTFAEVPGGDWSQVDQVASQMRDATSSATVVLKLQPDTHYKLQFKNMKTQLSNVFILRTRADGCEKGYKCCEEDSGMHITSMCVKSNFFGRTCSAVKGRRGARNAAGGKDSSFCRYCNSTDPDACSPKGAP